MRKDDRDESRLAQIAGLNTESACVVFGIAESSLQHVCLGIEIVLEIGCQVAAIGGVGREQRDTLRGGLLLHIVQYGLSFRELIGNIAIIGGQGILLLGNRRSRRLGTDG